MDGEYITILLMCYNAEKTIIESLDSVKNQSYKYIDLVVNDDGSTDHSFALIEQWANKNNGRFRSLRILKNDTNRGINYSFDKLVHACKTKWAKILASDDILFTTCIEDGLSFIKKNNISTMLLTDVAPFIEHNHLIVQEPKDIYELNYAKKICSLTAQQQYRRLLKKDVLFSPSCFFNVEIYIHCGGITQKIKNIEDWPLRLLFTKNGYKIYFFDKETVYYRLSDSVSKDNSRMYNRKHVQQCLLAKRILAYPYIPKYHIVFYFSEIVERLRYFLIIDILGNRITLTTRVLNTMLKFFEIEKLPERLSKFFLNRRLE